MTQIGNHTSKSEASLQSVTALNVGETVNSLTDQLEARHQREHRDVRYFWIQEQVRDEDFTVSRRRIAQMLERSHKTMDPTLHYKMKRKSRGWIW